MNKIVFASITTVIAFAIQTHGFADDFNQSLNRMGMTFNMPEGYISIPPKPNSDMEYDFAIRHPKVSYEIRFSLRPAENLDVRWELLFVAVAANISGKGIENFSSEQPEEPHYIDPTSVKAAFGADSALMVGIDGLQSEFAGKHKSCGVICLNKIGVGQAYIFHMFGDTLDGGVPTSDIQEALRVTYPPFGGITPLRFIDRKE